jgi:hypothetical protein
MKRLIILTMILFVAFGVFVVNLPPREMTMKDLHPVIVPAEKQLVIGNPDTSSTETREVQSVTVHEDTSRIDPPSVSPDPVKNKGQIEYYIIIESISDQAQAKKKAKTLKEKYNTEIIVLPPSTKGNFRLSFGKYSSSEEAKSVIQNVKKQIRPDAWIYSAAASVQKSGE